MSAVNSSGEKASGAGRRQHWAEIREAGTLLGLRFLSGVHRVFGRGIFTLFLYPAMAYFALVRPTARRASLDFLRTHYSLRPDQWSSRPGLGAVIRHFVAFGQSALDKALAWTIEIRHDDFTFTDWPALEAIREDPRGRLVIGSHHGNLEFCRGYMKRYEDRTINILVHEAHALNFAEMMRRVNEESRMNVYQVEDLDIAMVLKLKTRLEQGEWLFIAGDRIPVSGATRTTQVEFLGRGAPFPVGPYLLAQSLGCPVTLMFAFRLEGNIVLEAVPLAESLTVDRKDRERSLNQYAQRFADALADRCLRAPFQWFNFYGYWQEGKGMSRHD